MKNTSITCVILLLLSAPVFIISCSEKAPESAAAAAPAEKSNAELIKEGEHLVTIMGCNDCHSPKRMGAQGPEIIPELMLSGFPSDRPIVEFDSKMIKEGFAMMYPDLTAAAGPWGISFAANLTPDETGLANWTEAQFGKALREGKLKGMDGMRPLLPPMPWQNYITLTDAEIKSIFAYLKSISPVKNLVPQPIAPDQMKIKS